MFSLAVLLMLPGLAGAEDRALRAQLAAHVACAEAGEESGVCAGILTTHCLETARNTRELTACRAGVTAGLEAEVQDLRRALAARGAQARAVEVMRGAERAAEDVCAALGGRMATPGSAAHDIRCAMMSAHVTVYHLQRLMTDLEKQW